MGIGLPPVFTHALALLTLLSAAPTQPTVASTDWASSGLDAALASTLESRFLDLLSTGGIKVTSSKDVAAFLGLERQKQLLGCSATSCTAELAGALGVDAILFASVVRAGSGYTVSLRVTSATNAQSIASMSGRAPTVDALQDWLDAAATKLARQLRANAGITEPANAGETERGGTGNAERGGSGNAERAGSSNTERAGSGNTERAGSGRANAGNIDRGSSANAGTTGRTGPANPGNTSDTNVSTTERANAGSTETAGPEVTLAPAQPSRIVPWVPAMVGGLAAIGGAVVFVQRNGPATELQTQTFASAADVSATRTRGETFEKVGLALMVTGGAAIAASVVWFALTPASPVTVSIAPTRSGAFASVTGAF